MAQTKSRSNRGSKKSGNSKAGSTTSSKGRTGSNSASGKGPAGKTKSAAGKGASKAESAVEKGTAKAERAAQKGRDVADRGAGATGEAIESSVRRIKVPDAVKTPALVAGVGLAGLAGGVALSRSARRSPFNGSAPKLKLPSRSAVKVNSKNVAQAAKSVGLIAERTGEVAERVRVASEAMSDSADRRRSPIEVVLEGLTSRSSR